MKQRIDRGNQTWQVFFALFTDSERESADALAMIATWPATCC